MHGLRSGCQYVVVCCGEELALVYHFKVGSAGSTCITCSSISIRK